MTNVASRFCSRELPGELLRIHREAPDVVNVAHWHINGYPAAVVVWTAEEWAALEHRPLDAQAYPNGIWCALRIG